MAKSATPWRRGRIVWIPDGTELQDNAGDRVYGFDGGGQRMIEIRSALDEPVALIWADEDDALLQDNLLAVLGAGADDGDPDTIGDMYPTADEQDALPALRFVYDHDDSRVDLVVDGMSVAHWKVPQHPTRRISDIVPAIAIGNALKAAPWWFARAVLAQFTDDLSVKVVNTVRTEVLGE